MSKINAVAKMYRSSVLSPVLNKNFNKLVVRSYSTPADSIDHGTYLGLKKDAPAPWAEITDPNAYKNYVSTEKAIGEHAAKSTGFWKKAFYFICVPIMIGYGVKVYTEEKEHLHHLYERRKIPDDEIPPEYPYQNVRNRKFWWGDGDKSAFWNDKINRHRAD